MTTLRISALVFLLFVTPDCRPRKVKQAPIYNAAISIWDGPNACYQGTSFIGSFLGGLICDSPKNFPVRSPRRDFNYGGEVKVLTPSTYVHGYSLPTPISSGNRFVAVNTPDGQHWVLNLVTGVFSGIPGTSNSPIWDPGTDEIFYYPSGTLWKKHNALTGEETTVADMSFALRSISNGGSTHISSDAWTSFYDAQTSLICALDLRSGKSYCANYRAPDVIKRVGYDSIDYTMTTDVDKSSGKRYILLMASPALAAWTVDENSKKLIFAFRGGENPAWQSFNQSPTANGDGYCDPTEACLNAPHGDAVSIEGVQYFITSTDTVYDPCERDLVAMKISDAEAMVPRRITLLPLAYCNQSPWPDVHVGCSNKTGTCAISTEAPANIPYGNEILWLRDLSHVWKLAQHLSKVAGTDTYWYSSRAAISWDGRYIIFDSNNGQPEESYGFSHEQVFLIPLTSHP